MHLSEWSEVDGKIYVLDIHDLHKHIVFLHHDTKVTGYTGH